MTNNRVPTLQWVFIEGTLLHISEYAHLPPATRPSVTCPICGQPVVMKLGKMRTHHVAHHQGSMCATNQPETVIHLNTKLHIAKQLEKAHKLLLSQSCTKNLSHKEPIQRQHVWTSGWDAVEIEYSLGSYRPDIALLKNGQVMAVIEILVTHEVESGKAQYFEENGIRWLEVLGREELYSGPALWSALDSLSYSRISPKVPSWTCSDCVNAQATLNREQKLREETRIADYERRIANYNGIWCSRIVDFYYPEDKHWRGVYRIHYTFQDGRLVKVALSSDKGSVWTWTKSISRSILEQVNKVFLSDVNKRASRHGFWDSPMKWKHGNANMVTFREPPRRYVWTKYNKWWLHPDNREAHWDELCFEVWLDLEEVMRRRGYEYQDC